MPIKSGVLFKRGAGGLFQRKNWKPRYFELSDHALRYYTHQGGACKGQVCLDDLDSSALELMPTDLPKTGSSASTGWRIAIQTPTRRFVVAAATHREMTEWMVALLTILASHAKPNPTKHRNSNCFCPRPIVALR
ncbi:hypothetical protein SPRG_13268 [Saprolegnia parasitica CBS 223.65]|uniref:PH domain-containing protein n=1 Tax=Saprolegnia parasitica (strain CBS 223.65) TaxID=695850 RepID=A0A067BST3_SAPPC|nr:hypothetical protein SPRG_13268 [Saprolegnia parasitica CBS 223.65]KDO21584.1 hypothetical protein SPRG_13268 [Saprolegnia parasitica CBS 223.65]|eukprot:XP_012207675.1 hypothetical protein SPRG_13268 [Saprolegnia parasitica CBS 223.65]